MKLYVSATQVGKNVRYLTPGKVYEVKDIGDFGAAEITGDNGEYVYICFIACPHLDYARWTIHAKPYTRTIKRSKK